MNFISIGAVCHLLGISLSTAYRWIKLGKLKEFFRTLFNDKNFLFNSMYDFVDALNNIKKEFENNPKYYDILLHLLQKNSKIIKKTNGNLLKIRSWFYSNINNLNLFNEYIHNENIQKTLIDIPFIHYLKWINFLDLPNSFTIGKLNKTQDYENILKTMLFIFNHNNINEYLNLNIKQVEGQFVFNKKYFQLTFFLNKNNDNIEQEIDYSIMRILDLLQKFLSIDNNKPDLFEFIFKNLNYDKLNLKLLPNKLITKPLKI